MPVPAASSAGLREPASTSQSKFSACRNLSAGGPACPILGRTWPGLRPQKHSCARHMLTSGTPRPFWVPTVTSHAPTAWILGHREGRQGEQVTADAWGHSTSSHSGAKRPISEVLLSLWKVSSSLQRCPLCLRCLKLNLGRDMVPWKDNARTTRGRQCCPREARAQALLTGRTADHESTGWREWPSIGPSR